MQERKCRPDSACSPINTLMDDGEYYIMCYYCDKKWKWKVDEKELEEFRKKYGIT